MSKSKADTKRRILAVYRILKVNNMLTLREIKSRLSSYYQIDVSKKLFMTTSTQSQSLIL